MRNTRNKWPCSNQITLSSWWVSCPDQFLQQLLSCSSTVSPWWQIHVQTVCAPELEKNNNSSFIGHFGHPVDGVNGMEEGNHYFAPLRVSLYQKNMKIWCKIPVRINPLLPIHNNNEVLFLFIIIGDVHQSNACPLSYPLRSREKVYKYIPWYN